MPSRGKGAKSGGALPKLRMLCPKTAFLGPKWPQNPLKTAKRRDTVATLHMRHDCAMTVSPFLPSNSTICPRNGPKMAKNGAHCGAVGVEQPRNQERAVSLATWLKTEFQGHILHPQPPTFCGFLASDLPNRTPRPPYKSSLGGAGGQRGPRTVGANGGSTRVPGAKETFFPKLFLDHLRCSSKCF